LVGVAPLEVRLRLQRASEALAASRTLDQQIKIAQDSVNRLRTSASQNPGRGGNLIKLRFLEPAKEQLQQLQAKLPKPPAVQVISPQPKIITIVETQELTINQEEQKTEIIQLNNVIQNQIQQIDKIQAETLTQTESKPVIGSTTQVKNNNLLLLAGAAIVGGLLLG